MKNKGFKNILCFLLCFSMVAFSLLTGGYIGDVFQTNFLNLIKRKSVAASVVGETESCFDVPQEYSIVGYGGGGYEGKAANDEPKDIEELKKEARILFKKYKKSGDIDEVKMGATSKTETYGIVDVNNKTSFNVNIKNYINKRPNYKKITKSKPYILIYHTHTTEGYEMLDLGWYSKSYNSRTTDGSKTVVRVGDEIARELEKAGYKVIHDKTIYDRAYNGAYSRSREGIEKILKKNPSIVLTLDIHRDAIEYESGTKCKPTVKINGKKAAQVMIISGCEGADVTDFPNWRENFVFALNLQKNIQKNYEGLMRPVMFCHRKYNMDITPCSLLLEFGTDANTLEEAVYSGELVGKAIGEMLNREINKEG